MEGSKKYIIYRHITPDGRSYIGCTSKTLKQRWILGYKHSARFIDEVKKYGWNGMKHEILSETNNEDQAYVVEQEMIQKYQSNNPLYGYNISKGGKSTFHGLHHTEKHKQYMRDKLKGIKFSKEHIEHLKEGHAKERISVVCFQTNDGEQKYYESLGLAADSINGYKSNISRACDNGKLYKGFYWRRVKKEVNV